MGSSSYKARIDRLPNAKRISKRWRHMKAAKESRHSKTVWKHNPLKLVNEPASVTAFKALSEALRHRMWNVLAIEAEFNPRKLVTYQPVISASAVLDFAKHPGISKKKAYILGTEDGPCLWNGNHRAVADLITGRKFRAIFLDLTGGTGKYVYKH